MQYISDICQQFIDKWAYHRQIHTSKPRHSIFTHNLIIFRSILNVNHTLFILYFGVNYTLIKESSYSILKFSRGNTVTRNDKLARVFCDMCTFMFMEDFRNNRWKKIPPLILPMKTLIVKFMENKDRFATVFNTWLSKQLHYFLKM